jgi:hypothetical protein
MDCLAVDRRFIGKPLPERMERPHIGGLDADGKISHIPENA